MKKILKRNSIAHSTGNMVREDALQQRLYWAAAQKEEAASDYQKLQTLLEEEAGYTAEYDQLMESWEALSEAIAAEEG